MSDRLPQFDRMKRETYLRRALRDVHTDITSARAAAAFTALSTLRRQAQQIRAELDAEVVKTRAEKEAARRAERATLALTSTEKQLAEVRKMRAAAEEAQSWVAATTLLREERSLSEQIEAQRRADEAAQRAEIPADDLLGELASVIMGLPEGAREQLLELVDAG